MTTLKQMDYGSRRPQQVTLLPVRNRNHQNWTIRGWKNMESLFSGLRISVQSTSRMSWSRRFTSLVVYGPRSLGSVSNVLLKLCREEGRQFWRRTRVQPGTSKVYLIKWLMSMGHHREQEADRHLVYGFYLLKIRRKLPPELI